MSLQAKFIADFSSFMDAVQKAEVSLVSFETGSSRAEKSLNRMTDSFSGRRVIQEAALMSEAIDRAGGTSKLTATELERAGAKAAEAAEKMSKLGIDVPPNLQKLVDATTKVEPQLTMADKAAGLLKSTFGQFTAANLAATAISALSAGIKEFVDIGTRLPAVESSFARLSIAARQNSGEMLEAMTRGTLGMVSNYDLMLSANKAYLLGVPATTKSMGELADTATKLGRAMGMDATKSLNDLITALGRSSPMILDNLGLTVRIGEANEAYAAKLGKTSEQLTDAERKMAFYEAAMEAARRKTEELGNQTMTLGEIAGSAWTSFGNVVSGTAATVNVGLGAVLTDAKEFAQFAKDSIAHGAAMAMQMAATRAQMRQLASAAAAPDALPVDPLVRYREELNELRASIVALTPTQQALVREALALGQSTADIALKIGASTLAVGAFAEGLKSAKAEADKKAAALVELSSAGDGWKGTIAAMNTETVKAIQNYLDAGVSQAALATYYGVTATQVKAVVSQMADEVRVQKEVEAAREKTEKATARMVETTSKLWNEHAALLVARTGTTTDIQIAEVKRWADNVEAEAIRSGMVTAEFYEALEALSREKIAAIMVDQTALRDHSRLKLDETAERARATYEAMLARSGEFSIGTIEEFRKTAEAAELAAAGWSSSFGSAFSELGDEAEVASTRMSAAAASVSLSWNQAMDLVRQGQGTMSGTIAGSWGWSGPEGGSYNRLGGNPTAGPNMNYPGFASGVENFKGGLAYVHKDEMLVNMPAGTDVIPAISASGRSQSVTNVFNVSVSAGVGGSSADLARMIKIALVDAARDMGRRLPSGGPS
jgi:hypothetical protein